MAKYQVLKRVPHQIKYPNNQLVSGEMVEFVQIPNEGPSQVQVYFVPENMSDEEVLGTSTRHHEEELKRMHILFTGPQSPLNNTKTVVEPVVDASRAEKDSVKEAIEKPVA